MTQQTLNDGVSFGEQRSKINSNFTELYSTKTANSNAAITGGSITGITDLAVADGGTGASDAAGARANLGLGSIATQNSTSVNIDGGSIDGTAIGGSTPAAGSFTTLSATGRLSTAGIKEDASGNLAVGTANADATTLHLVPTNTDTVQRTLHIGYNGNMTASASGSYISFGNSTPSTLQLARIGAYYEGGAYAGSLRFYTNSDTAGATPPERLRIDFSGHILPGADNTQNLGSASKRLKEIFCGNSVINTSDGTLKDIRGELTEAEIRAWERVRLVVYRWKDSVEEKGDAARLHAGRIAQEVEDAFAAEGLDAFSYALLCKDEIFEDVQVEDGVALVDVPVMDEVVNSIDEIKIIDGVPTKVVTESVRTVQKTELRGVVDADDNPVMEEVQDGDGETRSIQVTYSVPVTRKEEQMQYRTERISKGYRYGLRDGECSAFEAAYLRVRLAAAEAQMASVLERLNALESA